MTKAKHYRPAGKRKEGNVAKYTTRNKALNRLQLKLPEFRRLCILKGIHPREPKKKFEGHNKTYYHVKDINFLAHEPLLEKSRELKAYERKIKKARAKRNEHLADRLESNRPSYTLDHLVKERYPSFVDALRDLDDPLTMLHLFAVLPADGAHKIPVSHTQTARRLALEWQALITRTHALRKCFVSVKGIYYQAEVGGQKVTWLTPHVLSQVLPSDVDFRVMLTFVEFYETLVGFVNFKLYHDLGLQYPPILDHRLEKAAAELFAVMRDMASEAVTDQVSDGKLDQVTDEHTEGEELSKRLAESQARLASFQDRMLVMEKEKGRIPSETGEDARDAELAKEAKNLAEDEEEDAETKICKQLFKGLKFFLGREVPRESLLFVIRAFGGTASWEGEGAPFDESDESITHQIVDRPTKGHRFLSRDYLQPQWVYDCSNTRVILPGDLYLLGRVLPPHLSPFVDNDVEGYLPEYAETLKRLQAAASKHLMPLPGAEDADMEQALQLQVAAAGRTQDAEETLREKEAIAMEKEYTEDLTKELAGIPYSASLQENPQATSMIVEEGNDDAKLQAAEPRITEQPVTSEADEATRMGRMMMTRKSRGLYDAAKMGNAKKKAATELLKERKRKADEGKHETKGKRSGKLT
ncbi:unnamed protein product [Sphagnum troendelagicum]|uniref:Pescadillo homolog n=1 Tax=Sphagnum troendelagicum TaxID=128251 RepID=A0ABP0U4H9_9BRYO